MTASLRMDWTLDGSGCALCTVEDERATVRVVVSYLTTAPEDLLVSVARLLSGDAEARAQFEAEPTAYRWIFYREGEEVWIRLLELRDGGDHDHRGYFDDVAHRYRESGYRGKWGEHFPRAELEHLRRLYRARPTGTGTRS